MNARRWIFFVLGWVWFGLIVGVVELPLALEARLTLGIFCLAAWYWVTEPIPIYATSLGVIFLQVVLLSSEGVLRGYWASTPYEAPAYEYFFNTLANPILLLFLGGFVLARAAVKFQLDRSLTRGLLRPFGTKPSSILAGFIFVTALLSAFMSNTATTAMMMTVVFPVVARMAPEDRYRVGLAIAIPFAANLGGMLTPIGSPPNAVVLAALRNQEVFISFSDWMILTAPLVLGLLLMLWLGLRWGFPASGAVDLGEKEAPTGKRLSRYTVYAVFLATVVLWVTETLHGVPSALVAMLPVVVLTATGLVDREDVRGLAWEVLWLVAGGIALGISLRDTGLAEWLVELIPMGGLGPWSLLLILASVGMIGSTFLSNTVTASLLIPLAISLLIVTGPDLGEVVAASSFILPPGWELKEFLQILGLTVACSASLGMALPISTPPNAIAVATGLVSPRVMMTVGLLVGFGGIVILGVVARVYWAWML